MFNLNRPVQNSPTVPADALDITKNAVGLDILIPDARGGVVQGWEAMSRVFRVSGLSSRFTKSGTWNATALGGGRHFEASNAGLSDNLVAPTTGFLEIVLEKVAGFRVVFEIGADRGKFTVTIDGLPPNDASLALTVEADSYDGGEADFPNGIVDTFGAVNEMGYVAWYGLDEGQHTIRITKTGTRHASSTGYQVSFMGLEHTPKGRTEGVTILPFVGPIIPAEDATFTYTGTWNNTDGTSFLRGRSKRSNVAPAVTQKIDFSFTGIGVILFFFCDGNEGNVTVTVKDSVPATVRLFDIGMVADSGSGPVYSRAYVIANLPQDAYTVEILRKDEFGRWDGAGGKEATFEGARVIQSVDDLRAYPGLLFVGEKADELSAPTVAVVSADAAATRRKVLVRTKAGAFATVDPTDLNIPDVSSQASYQTPLAVVEQLLAGRASHWKTSRTDNPALNDVQDQRNEVSDYRHLAPFGIPKMADGIGEAAGSTGSGDPVGTIAVSVPVYLPHGAYWLRAKIEHDYLGGTSVRYNLEVQRLAAPQHFWWGESVNGTGATFTDTEIDVYVDDLLTEGWYLLRVTARATMPSAVINWIMRHVRAHPYPARRIKETAA